MTCGFKPVIDRSQLNDSNAEYYASAFSSALRPIGPTCSTIATRLKAKTKAANRTSVEPSGAPTVVQESLYNKNRELVMTFAVESMLVPGEVR